MKSLTTFLQAVAESEPVKRSARMGRKAYEALNLPQIWPHVRAWRPNAAIALGVLGAFLTLFTFRMASVNANWHTALGVLGQPGAVFGKLAADHAVDAFVVLRARQAVCGVCADGCAGAFADADQLLQTAPAGRPADVRGSEPCGRSVGHGQALQPGDNAGDHPGGDGLRSGGDRALAAVPQKGKARRDSPTGGRFRLRGGAALRGAPAGV